LREEKDFARAPGRGMIKGMTSEQMMAVYGQMVLLREFELAAQKLYRAGRMPGFIHLYVGEEAVAAGVCAHLRRADWITSTHRGHGHALAKGVPPKALLAELYGKETGCCGGRGGSMHLYAPAVGLFGSNGFVGGGLPAAVGLGLSAKVRRSGQVAVAFFGDGAVNHGAFHEAVNLATVQDVPVIFVCENNLYATATPLTMATKNTDIASRAAAYGLPGVAVDGNDAVAVWEAAREAVERARAGGGPTLIEARTYRTVGHHEGDPLVGTYRTQAELDAWRARCPISRLRRRIETEHPAAAAELTRIEAQVAREVEEATAFAEASALPDPATATRQVWAEPVNPPVVLAREEPSPSGAVEQGWLDSVRDGVAEEMRRDPGILYLGEGIGERGGSFAHTKGLWREFGGHRVIDTPISELGFTGAAVGASASGCRTVADLMFVDFLFEAASQIIEQAGKLRYMSNGQVQVPMVIRAAIGALDKGAGPHHSGTYHPIWAHCPGLIVVVPSNPADAKGLIKTALRASDPVIFLEHKALFGLKGPVPSAERYVPFGRAAVVRPGRHLTVVTCGELVRRTVEAAAVFEREGIDCEIIDLRTIVPLDLETICASVAKTGRLLVVDEAFPMCGLGAEISASVLEVASRSLKAPVGRLHPEPATHPFSPVLQNAMLVTQAKIVAAARAVLEGRPLAPARPRTGLATLSPPVGASREQAAALPAPARQTLDAAPVRVGVPILLPNLDLTVTEATIVQWLKQVGDPVRAGEELVEVESEKSVFRVESPVAGRLSQVLVRAGEVVELAAQRPLGLIQPDPPA
jgi:2-oxoisovalerate dehydrogenase E1 component